MGVASLLFGLLLLLPALTMDPHIAPVYRYIVALGISETVWGLLFAATGALRLYAVLGKRHRLRRTTALVGCWKWGLFAVALTAAQPFAALPLFMFVLCGASILSYLSGVHCEVVDGRCNGTLEHLITVLVARDSVKEHSGPG